MKSKYLISLSLGLILSLETLFLVTLYQNLRDTQKREMSSLQQKNKLSKEGASDKKQIQFLLDRQQRDPLTVVDKERIGPDMCGYENNEVLSLLTKPKAGALRFEISDGIWSRDCRYYAYPLNQLYPGPYGDPSGENLEFGQEVSTRNGIWIFDSKTKKNYQLHTDVSSVVRWLTPNILVTGDHIVNVVENKVLGSIDNSYEFVKYKNPHFPWTFSYPYYWQVNEESDNLGNIEKITLKTPVREIIIYKTAPNFPLEKYDSAVFGVTNNTPYIRYYNQSLPIAEIYITKSPTTYPGAVTAGKSNTEDYISGLQVLMSSIEPFVK